MASITRKSKEESLSYCSLCVSTKSIGGAQAVLEVEKKTDKMYIFKPHKNKLLTRIATDRVNAMRVGVVNDSMLFELYSTSPMSKAQTKLREEVLQYLKNEKQKFSNMYALTKVANGNKNT